MDLLHALRKLRESSRHFASAMSKKNPASTSKSTSRTSSATSSLREKADRKPASVRETGYPDGETELPAKSAFEQLRIRELPSTNHIETRRYLNVAADGTCFRYSVEGYAAFMRREAIAHAFR
jgi:hypothetical protein